mgnify:CR=1 FL=1
MIVLDHEPHWWFLLQDGETLLLDVHCSHSAVDYSWVMTLNSDEAAQFKSTGRAFLTQLAERVQWSAPGIRGSTSPFRGRNLSRTHDRAVSEAIKAWRGKSAGSHG